MRYWKNDSFDRAWDYYDDARLLAFVVVTHPARVEQAFCARFIVADLLAADRNFTTLDEAKNYVEAMFALEQ